METETKACGVEGLSSLDVQDGTAAEQDFVMFACVSISDMFDL